MINQTLNNLKKSSYKFYNLNNVPLGYDIIRLNMGFHNNRAIHQMWKAGDRFHNWRKDRAKIHIGWHTI